MPKPRRKEPVLPESLGNVFEERAENLSREELEDWSATTPRDEQLLKKLCGQGSKLLSGPRGSGKSTLLKRAFFSLLDEGRVLPVYVNFAQSLALEPLFHKYAHAHKVFRQWVLYKIVTSVAQSYHDAEVPHPGDLTQLAKIGAKYIHDLEVGDVPKEIEHLMTPSELLRSIEGWLDESGYSRAVLLLDDAAHAFSPEQQQDFFEVFRQLRSRWVSSKAAVYPGITSYSPYFHVGHEAEMLEAWYRPDDEAFIPAMRRVLERRLPTELRSLLENKDDLVDMVAMASFGLPRGFLNMIAQLLDVDGDVAQPTRRRADGAIAEHAESVRSLFFSLSAKLPRFRHFIDVGRELLTNGIGRLTAFNKKKGVRSKAVVLALEEPVEKELDRILKFLEYAGVVRFERTVSRGVKGSFKRYSVHYAVLLAENALSLGRSPAVTAINTALQTRDAHAFVRTKGKSLLGSDFASKCNLDLPACSKCGTPRVAEEQRFCMSCGEELSTASLYDELLHAPVDQLPITQAKIDGILRHTNLATVQDVLLDDDSQQLRTVPYIGPVWAARIRTHAEEFVSV